ncbi:hypothetical protein NMG60_11034558 [Bertholletia excelsa]
MKWLIEIEKKVQALSPDSAQWGNWSIYKIPPMISDLNKKAYAPQMVSFGPYHHGEENLMAMEEHKERALLHFLKRTQVPLQSIYQSLVDEAQKLKDSYKSLEDSWHNDTERFLQLMMMDGCFIIEILRVACAEGREHSYHPDDPVFSDHGKLYVLPFIKRDMLLLENQLPMLVLIKLLGATDKFDTQEEVMKSLNKLILRFCNQNCDPATHPNLDKCVHILDLHRKSLLGKTHSNNKTHPSRLSGCFERVCHYRSILTSCKLITLICRFPQLDNNNSIIFHSATELYEAGIRFKKSNTPFLDDISFKNGILRLPTFIVDDMTESTFLNLIAFERCHVGAGHHITSFICFMDNIVEVGHDINHLCSAGVLKNATGSHKAAATLFNTMTKDLTMDPRGELSGVQAEVAKSCKKPWNKYRANLIQTYFRSPWALISVIAAILLFGLTIVQTIYSILGYGQG